MRAKITRGANIRGAVNYDLNLGSKRVEGKTARFIGGNMSGNTADELVAEFESIRQLRPDIAKPVWKEALRVTAGEDISAEKWNEIAVSHMAQLGIDPYIHPHMITQHVGEDHIHIMALRIAVDGSIYHGKNENLIASRDCQRLEKEFNLVRTSGAKYRIDEAGKHHIIMPQKSKPRSGEIKGQERTGKIPPRLRLQEIITTAVKDRPTQQIFEKRLVDSGVSFNKSTGGYSYEVDGIAFKGSQLGTNYKWAQLQKQFTTPEQAAKLQAEAELQALYSTRRRAWEEESRRRNKYRANRSISHSVCQISYSILPRPLGQAVQIAADIINIISKINDWRDANNYRNQVEKLTARMHQINATRLAAKESKVVQVLPVQKTKPVIPSPVGPVVSKAQSEALPPEKKTNLPIQQPAVESNPPAPPAPVLTAAEIKMLGQANWEMLRYGENRRVRELQAIIHPGLDIDVHRKPCPILVNGVPITEIENQIKPTPTQGITRTGGRK